MESISVAALFRKYFDTQPDRITQLDPHGSERVLYRLEGGSKKVIGVINKDLRENRAFIYFTRHFKKKGLPVPEIYIVSEDEASYLEEDLGNETALTFLESHRGSSVEFPATAMTLYQKILISLAVFQIEGIKDLDLSYCYPSKEFDLSSMLHDMRYFESSFLKQLLADYDAGELHEEFNRLGSFLTQADSSYFMYRDFQARNIMVRSGELIFIDYQGGRKGPLQYDLVSLLYQSSARIPQLTREQLIQFYCTHLEKHHGIDSKNLLEFVDGFAALRMLQVLGTYGRQGLEHGKAYFLKSIPAALQNLLYLLEKISPQVACPLLIRYIEKSSRYERFSP